MKENDIDEIDLLIQEAKEAKQRERDYKQRLNLICRMAGNMYNHETMTHAQAVMDAIKLYNSALVLIQEEE